MAIVGVVVEGRKEWENGSPSSSVIWMDGAVAKVDCSAVDKRRVVYFADEGRKWHPQCIIRQKNQSHTTDTVDIMSSSRRMCMWQTLRRVGEYIYIILRVE